MVLKKTVLTANNEGFFQGVAYSAAILIEHFDSPVDAKGLLKEAGLTREMALSAKVDASDVCTIDEASAWPKEQNGK